MSLNSSLAIYVLEKLSSLGISEVCVCPGARNSPLVAILSHSTNVGKLKIYYHFEERSAAFFAIGKMKAQKAPVAVITTSGTAAGELLPACMEAYYSGLPLVLVTADRPRHYRHSGAPQSVEQVGIFGVYAQACIDIEGQERPEISFKNPMLPLHINVCFDEPLLESGASQEYRCLSKTQAESRKIKNLEDEKSRIQEFFDRVKNPVVLVGGLAEEVQQDVQTLLSQWKLPVYCESLSGLRESIALEECHFRFSNQIVERAEKYGYPVDGVIRIGNVPTLRFWRDLETKLLKLPVLSVSALPFSGLGRLSTLVHGDLRELIAVLHEIDFSTKGQPSKFLAQDRHLSGQVVGLLNRYPDSEPGLLHSLSMNIPEFSKVYLGNSLPIREWDLAATTQSKCFKMAGSRGANGIDGQVSSFYGFADPRCQNWGIIGDLTAMYDLPGPWVLSQMEEIQTHLVLINNGGGRIFSRMFPQPEFQNHHQFSFKGWADLWKLSYESWRNIPQLQDFTSTSQLIELIPCNRSTSQFWKEYQDLQTY